MYLVGVLLSRWFFSADSDDRINLGTMHKDAGVVAVERALQCQRAQRVKHLDVVCV